MVTSFTAREKSVNFDQFPPIPFALVLKKKKHYGPSSIRDRPSQLVILDHVSDAQVFNSDYAIGSDQIRSQLVQEIGTRIFDFGLYLSYLESRFRSVTRG
jgi:hypothetical protein